MGDLQGRVLRGWLWEGIRFGGSIQGLVPGPTELVTTGLGGLGGGGTTAFESGANRMPATSNPTNPKYFMRHLPLAMNLGPTVSKLPNELG